MTFGAVSNRVLLVVYLQILGAVIPLERIIEGPKSSVGSAYAVTHPRSTAGTPRFSLAAQTSVTAA